MAPDNITIRTQNAQSLVQACLQSDYKQVCELLEAGVSPSTEGAPEEGQKPILPMEAAILGIDRSDASLKLSRIQASRIIRELFKAGCNIDSYERNVVMYCAEKNHAAILNEFAVAGVRIRRYGFEIMLDSMLKGHQETMQVLIKHNCSANILNDRHSRPLLELASMKFRSERQKAIFEGMTEQDVVQMIMHCKLLGLNIDATDKIGATALMRSISAGNIKMLRALLKCNANVHLHLRNGVTALHLGAVQLIPEDFKLLISKVQIKGDLQRVRMKRLPATIQYAIKMYG